jgi:hypothetical protein
MLPSRKPSNYSPKTLNFSLLHFLQMHHGCKILHHSHGQNLTYFVAFVFLHLGEGCGLSAPAAAVDKPLQLFHITLNVLSIQKHSRLHGHSLTKSYQEKFNF